jgi:SRSO17 transposase
MIPTQSQQQAAVGSTIEQWSAYLQDLHDRIRHRFRRPELRERLWRYLLGLLGDARRKNGWQMAEAIGETQPRSTQRILSGSRWDADAVRDDLRGYVAEHLGDEQSGVLIVDETGFLKKGNKSVGVGRRYTGTAGKKENCQIGVFLAYASQKGSALVDRELYLPREWADDPHRRAEAGVPEEVRFATKGQLARVMLRRAFDDAEVLPAKWVVADSIYGADSKFRGWLEGRGKCYVLAVHKTTGVWHAGRRYQLRTLAGGLAEASWARASAGEGSKGDRLYEWACLELEDGLQEAGMRRWMLVRRDIDDPDERTFYLAYAPAGTPVEELARTAGKRWRIEECFEQAKGETGLDEYEVRKWEGWYRHVTLSLLAYAYLCVLRSVAEEEWEAGKKGLLNRISIPS